MGASTLERGTNGLPGELDDLWDLLIAADEIGLRLEIVNGLPVWETAPAFRHQQRIFQIQQSIETAKAESSNCDCVQVSDVYVRFPDGSHKRPDIAIFCREPDEQDAAVTLLPEAVVEIISKGFEKKDTEIGAPFYLSQGVKDVILLNPVTLDVAHYRRDGVTEHKSPKTFILECGCVCTV